MTGCADDETVAPTSAAGGSSNGGTSAGGTSAGKGGSAGTTGKGGSSGTGTGGGGASGSSGKGGTGGTGATGGGGTGGAGKGGGPGGGGSGGAGMAGMAGKGGMAGMAGMAGKGGMGGGGMGGSGGMAVCSPQTGDGTLTMKTKVADGGTTFTSPFDAAPSPDGTTVYFTAIDTASGTGAVYSVPAAGGAITTIATGMVAPTGIAVSGDGKTLFVADEAGAENYASGDISKDAGVFYTVGTGAGSTPTPAVNGFRPHSVTVAQDAACKDTVYVGTYTAGAPTISTFSGGTFTTAVTTNYEASGIAAKADGTLYWVETIGGPWASIQTAPKGGNPTMLVGALHVGYPAGLALSGDGTHLVLSGLDPADYTDSLIKLDTAGKNVTQQKPGTAGFVEAAGLHRASNAAVYATVDGLGSTGTGAIYVVKP